MSNSSPTPPIPTTWRTFRVTGGRDVTDADRALADAIGRPAHDPRPVPVTSGAPGPPERPAQERGRRVRHVGQGDHGTPTRRWPRSPSSPRGDPRAVRSRLRRRTARAGCAPTRTPSTGSRSRPCRARTRAAARPTGRVRDFVVGSRERERFLPAEDPDAPPPPVERPAVLLMGTTNDDRYAWLLAGRALGRLLLRATADGLAASPLTQALDLPATRRRMGAQLSLVGHPRCCCGSATPRPLTPVRRAGDGRSPTSSASSRPTDRGRMPDCARRSRPNSNGVRRCGHDSRRKGADVRGLIP